MMSSSPHRLPLAHPNGAEGTPDPPIRAAQTPAHRGEATMVKRVEAILAQIRPAVQDDGGDIELVEVTPDGVVKIRFHGACVDCPSSPVTLQTGIERNLRDRMPEVTSVIAVD